MKSFLIITLIAAAACTSGTGQKENYVRFNHVMLYVSDLERSVDFYTRAFPVKVDDRFNKLTIRSADGTTEIDVRMALLRFDGQDFVLELSEVADLSTNEESHYQHLGVNVLDIDQAYQDLVAAGATENSPIQEVSAHDIIAKNAFLLGPDGENIELMEVIKGKF